MFVFLVCPYVILKHSLLDAAENNDELRMVFAVDEILALLMETGYRKPVLHLTLQDKVGLRAVLLDYHCLLKVKGAMDQYAEGLQQLRVLDLIQKFNVLTKPFFVSDGKKITTSEYYNYCNTQCISTYYCYVLCR